MSFKFDLREFAKAVDEVKRNTRKTEPEIVNRAALTVIIGGRGVRGAIQRTPRADKGKIAGVSERQLTAAVVKKLEKKGKLPMVGGGKRNKRGQFQKVGGINLKAEVRKERARRMRSIAYTAGPGWDKAAQALGGRGVGKQPGFERSEAAKGSAKRATIASVAAVIENAAPAAHSIGGAALQGALDDTARDMMAYARKKLEATFKRNSAK